jgi:hypothetical protein
MAVPATSLTLTDRLAVKLYATNSGGKTTTIHTQDGHLCQIITSFSTGITALNGLTAQVQYFQTGTSGTDFNISSTTATHTFNIPDASATARGLITTGTQTIAGTKTFSDATKNNGGIFLQNGSSSSLAAYMNLGGLTNGVKFTSGGGISNTFTLPSATGYTFTFPNATGTIALTSDIPSLTGYVPYTGATTNVALGVYALTASGLTITTGTGKIVLNEGDATHSGYINWYAGNGTTRLGYMGFNNTDIELTLENSATFKVTGGAATFSSSITATSFVKTSGTSSQFLKADGSVDSSTYLTTSAAASTYLPLVGGTLTGILNINLSSGTAMNVAGNAIFRGDTGVATPRQLIIQSGGSTPVYLEAKGYGANYQTDFGIRTYNNVGTAFEVFYADSSGRVGINQVSPSYQLDVNGSVGFSGDLRFASANTVYNASGDFYVRSASNLRLGANGTNSLASLTTAGNLLLGSTTSGWAGTTGIELNGNETVLAFRKGGANAGYIYHNGTNLYISNELTGGSAGSIIFNNNAGTRMTITSDGNLLLGTTDNGSSAKLVFYSTSAAQQLKAAGTAPAITFSNTITSPTIGGVLGAATGANQFITGTASGDMVLANQFNTGSLIFGTSNTERMRITSGGQVLIGATSYDGVNTNALQIKGGTAQFLINNTAGTANHFTIYSASDGNIYNIFGTSGNLLFGTGAKDTSGFSEKMRLVNNGNLLIGTITDAGYKLQVSGTARFYDDNGITLYSPSWSFYRQIYPYNGDLYFTNGTNQGYLNSAGAWINASDISIKKDVTEIKYGLNEVLNLKPCSYKMKENNLEQIGFIAQEVEKILPELVQTDNKEMKGLSYGNLTAVLVKAIQEQQKQIEELKLKIK